MRTFNFAVAMTAFVCLASAQQDLDLEQDDFDLDEAEQEEQRKLDEYVNDPSFDQQDDEDYESDGASEDLLSDEDSDDGAPVDDQPTGRRLQSRRQRRNRVQRANRQRTPRTTNDTSDRPQRVPCRERATGPEFGCWFASDNYQAQNRGDKLDQLWDQITSSQIQEPTPFMWEDFPNFFTQKANGSFCQKSDILGRRRPKTVHTQGLVAKVEWEVVENPMNLTAIYESGSDTVLMRISETANLFEDSDGLTPSIALKFLIDGQESYNIFGMQALTASGDWNFFDPNLSNRLPPLDTSVEAGYITDQTLRKKMVEGNQRPLAVGISHIGQMRNDGSTLENSELRGRVPYELQFRAPDNLKGDLTDEQKFDADGNQIHWADEVLARGLGEGDVVYQVFGYREPLFPGEDPEVDDKMEHIANIRLKTPLVQSSWADERLRFRHRPVGRDRRFWPREWRRLNEDTFFNKNDEENVFGNEVPDWPDNDDDARDKFIDQVQEYGCPFEWLMPSNWSFP